MLNVVIRYVSVTDVCDFGWRAQTSSRGSLKSSKDKEMMCPGAQKHETSAFAVSLFGLEKMVNLK